MGVAFLVEEASAEGVQQSSAGTPTRNATPTKEPETPTKPEREAPPEEEPQTVPPPSPWKPATEPSKCPNPGREDLPFCNHTLTLSQVRRAD